MDKVTIAITAASYSGNKGAAAMLQSSIKALHKKYGERLRINLMSVYPREDRRQIDEMPDKYDFINVIPCPPEKLLFIAFPLAVLYWLFQWFPPMRALLRHNKIIRAYTSTDMVIDEAGISFVDSRGFVMNTYAFVCAAVPMLCKTDVVKYSQALGTFKNPWNKFLAKWILPKIKLICARGEITSENLEKIGITKNVKLCADGAFSMPDSEFYTEKINSVCENDSFYSGKVVALSISSVVQKKCVKMGRDYEGVMAAFANWLTEQDYNVLLIANAARIKSEKTRNNDLMICDAVAEKIRNKAKLRWYHEEMSAEEIREYLAHSKFLVASRFHAMIGALEKKTPVLLIGWSHKYKEVLDMFGLGQYAVDFSALDLDSLKSKFMGFIAEEESIKANISENLPTVLESSAKNIEYICEVIDAKPHRNMPDEPKYEYSEAKDKSKKKKIMKYLKIGFAVLVIVFMAWYFYKNWDDFKSIDMSINWGIFCLSMLFYFLYKFTLASLWHYLTILNGCSIKYEKAVTSYLYSILGKYIPGKVFMLAARLTYYKEEDAPLPKVTVCFFIENICTLLGAAMLFIVSLFFFPNDLLKDYMWVTIALIVAFFVCINPKIINFFLKILGKLFKKDLSIPMKYSQMIKVVLLFVANWLIVGTGFYILVQSIYPSVELSQGLYVAGIWGISAIMGILAIFAPSGIGVREGIIVAGLALIMPKEYAIIISVVSRLWQTIPELLLVALAFLYSKLKKFTKIKIGKSDDTEKAAHVSIEKKD